MRSLARIRTGLVWGMFTLSLLGLAQADPHHATNPPLPQARGGGPVEATDPGIAAVAASYHRAEIAQARLAIAHARDPRVRSMARSIETRHARALQSQQALVRELRIEPRESRLSADEREAAKHAQARLSTLRGPAFDTAYVRAQIAIHARSLRTMDEALLPRVRSARLRAAIQANRDAAARRLGDARALDRALSAQR